MRFVRDFAFLAFALQCFASSPASGWPVEVPLGGLEFRFRAQTDRPPSSPSPTIVVMRTHQEAGRAFLGYLPCSYQGSVYSCVAPGGRWDLRFFVPEHAPRYFWDVVVTPGVVKNMGNSILEPGSSLAGFVVTNHDQPEGFTVEALAQPGLFPGEVATEGSRSELPLYRAETDHRGLFQLRGLGPGSYRLRVFKNAVPAVFAGPFRVVEKTEFLLTNPIEANGARMAVQIEPPLDPYGEAWSLEIRSHQADSREWNQLDSGPANKGGSWSTDKAQPGSFELNILDSRANRWLRQDLGWAAGDPPLWIEVPRLPVKGYVRRGDDGVKGAVVFGTNYGARSLRFELGEKGAFEGFLPEGGAWPVELLLGGDEAQSRFLGTFKLEKRPGKSYAELDISLPDTLLKGKVRLAGKPIAEAMVTVFRTRPKLRRDAFSATNEDGSFEIAGLEPGSLIARATHTHHVSEWLPVELSEKNEVELEIEVEPKKNLAGQVYWQGGPVPGASIMVVPSTWSGGVRELPRATTSFGGSFEIGLSPKTGAVLVLATVAGFDLAFAGVSLHSQPWPPVMLELRQDGGELEIHGGRELGELELQTSAGSLQIKELLPFVMDRLESADDGLIIKGWPAGHYAICSGRGAAPPCATGALLPGSRAVLNPLGEKRP